MQPYGKSIEIRNSCVCCGTHNFKRSQAKADLRKLIEEESENIVVFDNIVLISEKSDFCSVCGDYKNSDCAQNC
jgi:hypothetical protein